MLGKIIFPQMFSSPSADFHYEITEQYMQGVEKLCIIAPRGHAKSSVVAGLWVMHHILCEPGKKFVLLTSKTRDHAVKLLETLKDAFNYSAGLRKHFGYWGSQSAVRWATDQVILKDGTIIMVRGTGQQVIGLKYIHQRPTMIVLDDPEDVENTRTREAMDRNLEWLLRSLVPTRSTVSRIVVIGTPQRENCMVEMIAKMSDWKTLRYAALKDDDLKCLWPDGPWPLERLLREKKAMQDIGKLSFFNREYMCRVTSDDDRFLHEPKFYDGSVAVDEVGEAVLTLIANETKRMIPVNIFVGIDPATSISQTADYTVIMPVALDSDRNIYVLPYVRRRMRPSETIQEILRINRNLKPRRVSLEATAAQETFRDILRNVEGEYIPGLERKILPRDRKDKRYLDVLEPYLYQGKVYVLRSMNDLVGEILSYHPSLSAHDDMLDALYYAIQHSYPPSHVVDEKTGEKKVSPSARLLLHETWATS